MRTELSRGITAPVEVFPGDSVWLPWVMSVRRLVTREVYEREPRAHALVLRDAQEEILAAAWNDGVELYGRASVEWIDPPPEASLCEYRPTLRLNTYEAVVSWRGRRRHVVGSDSPALRVVHEGLRDVLAWLRWPALPDGRVPGVCACSTAPRVPAGAHAAGCPA
jgi:hypothetical protein